MRGVPCSWRFRIGHMKKILLALTIVALLALPASAANFFWDSDQTAAGNNATTGDNLGGTGDWDNLTSPNWWDGTSGADTTWDDTANSGAIFFGLPGTVTLATPRTAASLNFKSSGYVITGSTLNLGAPATITVDPTMSADIASILAGTNGYSVVGGGTLNLTGTVANTITGAVSVTGGSTLQIAAANRIGGASGDVTLNNGTLRNVDVAAGNLLLSATRSINIGTSGGTLDAGTGAVLLYSGTINGPGNTTLTKTGSGEIRMNGTTDFTFQKLVINGGIYSLGQSTANGRDGQLGAVPANPMQDQV